LGAFVGNEDRIPYDYHEVLALIAPRPVLVAQPVIDYQLHRDHLIRCLQEAQKVYQLLQAPDHLARLDLDDYNRWSPESQGKVIEQVQRMFR
jgi:hypothetical protein